MTILFEKLGLPDFLDGICNSKAAESLNHQETTRVL